MVELHFENGARPRVVLADWERLTPQQQRAFREAPVQSSLTSPMGAQSFHPRLRVKRVQGHRGVWEMTWAPDGRATFEYGAEVRLGEAHVIWRRVGTHSVSRRP